MIRLPKSAERYCKRLITAFLMCEYKQEGFKYGKSLRGFKKWRKRRTEKNEKLTDAAA